MRRPLKAAGGEIASLSSYDLWQAHH